MAKFKVSDKVKVISSPVNWPPVTKFTLAGAEATVASWVDWPEAMAPYSEFVYVRIDQAAPEARDYEGVFMIFLEDTLEKIAG